MASGNLEKQVTLTEVKACDGNQYFLSLVMVPGSEDFRLLVSKVEKNTLRCWASQPLNFRNIRSPGYGADGEESCDELVRALTAQDSSWQYGIDRVVDSNKIVLELRRQIAGISVCASRLELLENKRAGGNTTYLLRKIQSTLKTRATEVAAYKRETDDLREMKTKALQQIDQSIKMKNETEAAMLHKFMAILNEKKKRIRQLLQRIKTLESGEPAPAPEAEAPVDVPAAAPEPVFVPPPPVPVPEDHDPDPELSMGPSHDPLSMSITPIVDVPAPAPILQSQNSDDLPIYPGASVAASQPVRAKKRNRHRKKTSGSTSPVASNDEPPLKQLKRSDTGGSDDSNFKFL